MCVRVCMCMYVCMCVCVCVCFALSCEYVQAGSTDFWIQDGRRRKIRRWTIEVTFNMLHSNPPVFIHSFTDKAVGLSLRNVNVWLAASPLTAAGESAGSSLLKLTGLAAVIFCRIMG